METEADFVAGDGWLRSASGFLRGGRVRRLALDLNATVGSASAKVNPGYWDPLIG
jgi:hypothetical protein